MFVSSYQTIKTMIKQATYFLLFLSALYGCVYVFNHFNAWVSFLLTITVFVVYFKTVKSKIKVFMKKFFGLFGLIIVVMLSSCSRVAPNYVGVLMENYGKEGKTDFSLVKGRVSTMAPGTELFQAPLWEQRADFGDKVLHLKAADNTEFTSRPVYSYKVIENRAIDVVFDNKHLDSGDAFMRSVEDNILEAKIYDLMREESRKYTTDVLMSNGGSLTFEDKIQQIVKNEFLTKGFELVTFSCQLDFSDKVKAKIDNRNEVNTNISVLDQQIVEQRKRNELAKLKAEEGKILSSGLSPLLIQQQFIDKWDGKSPLYGGNPISVLAK